MQPFLRLNKMGHRIYFTLIIILLNSINYLPVESNKPTRNIEITPDDEKLRDPDGYLAIKAIHATLDDDQSGSIDRAESSDFLAEDLKFGEKERERREKAFHGNDESITVDDLWEAWFQSQERSWDEKQVINWLINYVRLPQYADNFVKARVVGTQLPRMAVQNSTFLTAIGIKSYVHRQKLQLKALDLVLFGSQDASSPLKDIALAALLAVLITVLIVFKTHKNRSRRQMEELSTRLSKLRDMEDDFEGVQQKLDDENRRRHSIADEDENAAAIDHEIDADERDRRMAPELMNGFDGLHFSLQNLLRRTFEIESAYLNQQKLECLHEMREAKELVDKMRRKQTSIVNSLKLATGATSGTGDIDTKIFNLKTRMEKIKLAVDELSQRWADIESMCGFSITGPFGVAAHGQSLDASTLLAIKYQADQQHCSSSSSTLLPAHINSGSAFNGPPLNDEPNQNNPASHASTLLRNNRTDSAPALHGSGSAADKLKSSSLDSSNPPSECASIVSSQPGKKANRLKQFFKRKMKA